MTMKGSVDMDHQESCYWRRSINRWQQDNNIRSHRTFLDRRIPVFELHQATRKQGFRAWAAQHDNFEVDSDCIDEKGLCLGNLRNHIILDIKDSILILLDYSIRGIRNIRSKTTCACIWVTWRVRHITKGLTYWDTPATWVSFCPYHQ